jgi:membrane-bound metal-dependent hydrolase YbcI (DUF457 family)
VSPIAHSGIGLLGWEMASSRKNVKTFLLFLFVANMADLDFMLYLVFRTRRSYIHQYYTHNIFFVVIAASLLSLLLKTRRDRLGLILVGLFHLVQDIIVFDPVRPVGIRLFYPISSKLINLGFFPHLHRGGLRGTVSAGNAATLFLEALVFVAPVLIFFGKRLVEDFRRRDFWTI